jgi:hypothetical protein
MCVHICVGINWTEGKQHLKLLRLAAKYKVAQRRAGWILCVHLKLKPGRRGRGSCTTANTHGHITFVQCSAAVPISLCFACAMLRTLSGPSNRISKKHTTRMLLVSYKASSTNTKSRDATSCKGATTTLRLQYTITYATWGKFTPHHQPHVATSNGGFQRRSPSGQSQIQHLAMIRLLILV